VGIAFDTDAGHEPDAGRAGLAEGVAAATADSED